MTPEDLLRLYPRETLRWLRGRLGLTQQGFGLRLGIRRETIAAWEGGRDPIARPYLPQLAQLLAPHLATPEGEAFAQSLGRGTALPEEQA
jgi:transcriptional regulator with XRE-family HTH domain